MRGFGLSLVFVGELQCPVWTPAKIDRLKLTKIYIIHNMAPPVPRLSATAALFSHTVAAIFAVHLPPVSSL